MTIIVHLFASVAELAGQNNIELDFPEQRVTTIQDIEYALIKKFAHLDPLISRCLFAKNDEYCKRDCIVAQGDVLAIIPPVSGGSNNSTNEQDKKEVDIVSNALSPQQMYDHVIDARAGAVVVFVGTVREFTLERQTAYLHYEAYESMARTQLRRVIAECRAKWPIIKIAIWHRIGDLAISEISVVIGVSTAHRKDAFAAGDYAIQRLKQIVPIWKKEYYVDGEIAWGGPKEGWNLDQK